MKNGRFNLEGFASFAGYPMILANILQERDFSSMSFKLTERGTDKSIPGIPHITPQKTSPKKNCHRIQSQAISHDSGIK